MSNKLLILGPLGTYGHEAALKSLNVFAEFMSLELCLSNREILERSIKKHCYGVVPIANNSIGLVSEVIRDFWLLQDDQCPLRVMGEINISISHCLMALPETQDVSEIMGVLSHPQAFAQCNRHLTKLGLIIRESRESTAAAAWAVRKEKRNNVAALASRFAAEVYRLKILKEGMNDYAENSTCFHIVGWQDMKQTDYDKTAMIFRIPDRPRALLEVLQAIGVEGINISSIHSIPLSRQGEFAFYCEFNCHKESESGRRIISNARSLASSVLVLGSYPNPKP